MSRKQRIYRFIKQLYSRFRDDDVPGIGAQLTYYLILSFFPFLIFMVSVLGFVQLSGDSLVAELIRILPADTGESVSSIWSEVAGHSSGAFLSLGMIATLWSASNGLNAIIKGINKAYDVEESRPFWKVRGISLLATVVLAAVIMMSMLLLIFGKVIAKYVFRLLDMTAGFEWVWGVLRYSVPVATMIIVFCLLFWLAPNRRLRFREVIPGALMTTFGWITTSLLFQVYINQFGNYSKTYGSLGGIIVLLIWLYLSSILILLGGEINATLAAGKLKETPAANIKRRPIKTRPTIRGEL
ncbi:YihY/virulence factor BrkB family protein [Paenibacillus sp. N4]|uniref:YihY/virulence factor BrkB family protein n=1 Tax=Paenibacillus vietnamensis TaxID=2590547 RepID=UPI001CD10BFB|nr:YihY/virulence factor BrkB family protein [Paenibacillus vietnamensis]MCA0754290.1 YihY/virulence factor BrkB family protein [Paenibacillus vietnamensis]